MRGEDENWKLRKMPIYKDDNGKTFEYPPPNADVQQFIYHEIPSPRYSRGGYNDTLPTWIWKVSVMQGDMLDYAMAKKVTENKKWHL